MKKTNNKSSSNKTNIPLKIENVQETQTGNVSVTGIASTYKISKQLSKNIKQIELKSKIDISMKDKNKISMFKSDKHLHQIILSPSSTRKDLKNDLENIHTIPGNNHKKTISEIPKSMSNLETCEREDDDGSTGTNKQRIKYSDKMKKNKKVYSFNGESETADKNSIESHFTANFKKSEQSIDTSCNPVHSISGRNYGSQKNFESKDFIKEITTKTFHNKKNINEIKLQSRTVDDRQNLKKENYDLNKTINILNSIIAIQTKEIIRIKKECDDQLLKSKLKVESVEKEKSLIKENNKSLKSILLKLFTRIKNTEEENNNIWDSNHNKLISQILIENEYLRSSVNCLINRKEKSRTPSPLITEKQNNNQNQDKKKNRRATTLINIDEILNDMNHDISIIPDGVSEEREANEISKEIKEFKITKKNQSIAKPLRINEASNFESTNFLSKKLDSQQTNFKPRQQYLFFKTPNNEEKKKIEFPTQNHDAKTK